MKKINESIIYLFKSYLVDKINNNFTPDYDALKKGILIDIKCNQEIIDTTINIWGIDGYLLNQTFHKSLSTVANSNIEELIIKQIMHYITTYDFKYLGIYSKDTVYIPKEELKVPELNNDIKLININPITKEELKNKLWYLLTSSIALSKKTIECIINLSDYLEITNDNINKITNKEVKTALYDKLNLIPNNNIEFLRYLIYKLTSKTLLIKDKETIELLKISNKKEALELINKYNKSYSLIPLSEIFNRFKPLFLSLKTSKYIEIINKKGITITKIYKQTPEELELNKLINKISKLSKTNHKPLIPNDLDNFINWYQKNKGKENYIELLNKKLKKEPIWRIIKLKNYLSLINNKTNERVYKIRNGKVWITSNNKTKSINKETIDILDNIIINKLRPQVSGKRICIDKYLDIVIPQSEKQFIGNIPFSSKLTLNKDNLLVGIHWHNVNNNSVDLDLKIISNKYTIGWNADYRSGNKLLFTGDVTDAPLPNGASEYIYIDKDIDDTIFSLKVNNYTRNIEDIEYDLIIAKASKEKLKENYIVDPNDIIIKIPKNTITKDKLEHSLGNIIINNNKLEFIFTDLSTSNRNISKNSNIEEILRKYLYQESNNKCMLKEYLIKSGAIITDTKDNIDIDLSIDSLTKESIIKLLNN